MPLSERLTQLLKNPDSPPFLLREAVMEEPTMLNVYVVSGETGQYSGKCSWTVAGFLDKEQADTFCDRCNEWCKQLGFNTSQYIHLADYEDREAAKHPLDPNFKCDYTGTEYTVFEIPLRVEEGSENT